MLKINVKARPCSLVHLAVFYWHLENSIYIIKLLGFLWLLFYSMFNEICEIQCSLNTAIFVDRRYFGWSIRCIADSILLCLQWNVLSISMMIPRKTNTVTIEYRTENTLYWTFFRRIYGSSSGLEACLYFIH